MSESHKIHTSINQYDLDNKFIECFSSISDASNKTNTHRTSTLKCCKNIHKTTGGFKLYF